MTGEWFVIKSGPDAGRWHMAGWMHTAIKGEDLSHDILGDEDPTGGWLSLGICPRCHATIITEDRQASGDQQWAHEAWHHKTDHPHPEVTPEQLADLLLSTGPAGMADYQIEAVSRTAREFIKAGREELAARKEIRAMRGA
jgi:hypothetical protein